MQIQVFFKVFFFSSDARNISVCLLGVSWLRIPPTLVVKCQTVIPPLCLLPSAQQLQPQAHQVDQPLSPRYPPRHQHPKVLIFIKNLWRALPWHVPRLVHSFTRSIVSINALSPTSLKAKRENDISLVIWLSRQISWWLLFMLLST